MRKQQAAPQPEPEKFERWSAQRKAAIILEVLKGSISVPEASQSTDSRKPSFANRWTSITAPALTL